jgi:hypothetical protein
MTLQTLLDFFTAGPGIGIGCGVLGVLLVFFVAWDGRGRIV